jgi:hypothetical protein
MADTAELEIKAHANDPFSTRFAPHTWKQSWKDMQPAAHSLRCCSYCGSLHPLDLLDALKAGANLDPADWKYGWPHKFYVNGVPNELAGQTVEIGGTYDAKGFTPMMGEAPPHAYLKFHSEHLADLPEDKLAELSAAIEAQTGTRFTMEGGELHYRGRPPGYLPSPESEAAKP